MRIASRSSAAVGVLGALAVGMAAGVSELGGWLAAGLAAGATAWSFRWCPPATIWLLFGTLGWLLGFSVRAVDRGSCAATLPSGGVRLWISVEEPTVGKVPAMVRPLTGCRGAVSARFGMVDTVRAGDRLEVEARWLPDPRRFGRAGGLLAIRRVVRLGHDPGTAQALRNWLYDASRRLYGHRAGVVDALMLGRRGSIEPALSSSFARSGLVHILSISGFHVGLIGGWVFLLLRSSRLERHRARLAAAIVVTAYVAFIGAPPPAMRAVLLAWIVTLEGWRQRQPAPGSLFATTAVAVLVLDPFAIGDLGAWLSVCALSAATAVSRWSDVAVSRAPPARIIFGSIGATLGTAPIAAFAIGVIAPIGVLVNLVAIPVAAVAVPGVLASVLALPWSERQAEALAAGSGLLLDVMERAAMLGAAVPGGAMAFDPGVAAALMAALAAGAAAWIIGRGNTAREAGRRLAWAAVCLVVWPIVARVAFPAHTGARLTLHFLSVGQGDAALVRTPANRWILVDAGPVVRDRDAGQRVVLPFLIRHGVRRLAAIIVSHAHLDHYGGAGAVLARVGAEVVLEPGRAVADAGYREFLDAVDRAGARWGALRSGNRFEIDGVEFRVLHPDTTWPGWGLDLNEDSVVLAIRAGRFDAIFPGDAGFPVEARLRGRLGTAEVLKVGHHGSRTATGDAWLDELGPAVGIVSTGPNGYGHPAPAAMSRLAEAGVDVWRTDRDGTITVLVDDATMRVRGRRAERVYPLR